MDISAISSIAAAGTAETPIVVSMLNSTESLVAVQADILMASLGIGNNVNTSA